MCYIYSALVSVQLSKQLQRMWEKSSLGEAKQRHRFRVEYVNKQLSDERRRTSGDGDWWDDSDELNMLSKSELESHFLLRRRWNHNFACETLFLLSFFGSVWSVSIYFFFIFFWVSTRETLHTLRFTIGSFHWEHFKCVWLCGTGWRGIDTHTQTHTRARLVPGIVQEVNKKVFYFQCNRLNLQLKFSNFIQSWIQFAYLLSLFLSFYLSLEKSILQRMLCAVSERPKAKDQRLCVSTQDTRTQTHTQRLLQCLSLERWRRQNFD